MMTHTVIQGERLAEIALRHGFPSGRALYDHPANEEFRRKRPDPNLIFPGDRIAIPELGVKDVGASTENRHRFRKRILKKYLRIEMSDPEKNRLSERPYELRVGRGNGEPLVLEGVLDRNGQLHEEIPVDAKQGTLKVGLENRTVELDLLIDYLDPVSEISGIQARLKNLAFDCGPVDGVLGPKTRAALRCFQEAEGLSVTGEPDEPTGNALCKEHGC
jgi:N-acetylmuramoyl-L-alanine amidase